MRHEVQIRRIIRFYNSKIKKVLNRSLEKRIRDELKRGRSKAFLKVAVLEGIILGEHEVNNLLRKSEIRLLRLFVNVYLRQVKRLFDKARDKDKDNKALMDIKDLRRIIRSNLYTKKQATKALYLLARGFNENKQNQGIRVLKVEKNRNNGDKGFNEKKTLEALNNKRVKNIRDNRQNSPPRKLKINPIYTLFLRGKPPYFNLTTAQRTASQEAYNQPYNEIKLERLQRKLLKDINSLTNKVIKKQTSNLSKALASDMVRRLFSVGGLIGANQTNTKTLKRWRAELDNRTRPYHSRVNLIEKPLKERFRVEYPRGVDYLDAPKKPPISAYNSVNCRCWLEYLLIGK